MASNAASTFMPLPSFIARSRYAFRDARAAGRGERAARQRVDEHAGSSLF